MKIRHLITNTLLVISAFFLGCSTGSESQLVSMIDIPSYPSGSAASYIGDSYYVMGDDASDILVLDNQLNETSRISLFPGGNGQRIDKFKKADIESSATVVFKGRPALLFLGSGSLSPQRDSAFLLDLSKKTVTRLDLSGFYSGLRTRFREVNIEAASFIGSELLLGLRGNAGHPQNHLVRAEFSGHTLRFLREVIIAVPAEKAGISGMAYDKYKDILYITYSTEDTPNAVDDGVIGDSYLAIIPMAGKKVKSGSVIPDHFIRLTDISPEFQGQKIESVSLTADNRELLLVADNDQGTTRLFVIRI